MGTAGTTGTVITRSLNPDPITLTPTPTPVRRNPTTLERVAQDVRGIAQLMNQLTQVTNFLSLPPPGAVGVGVTSFITDNAFPVAGAFGLPAQGGGTFPTPVWSDGTNWNIG
jgi:hypothetical protein